MSTSDAQHPELEIEIAPAPDGFLQPELDAEVTVFDGHDRVVHSGSGQRTLQLRLPPGIYTVRVEQGERFEDRSVRHPAGGLVRFGRVKWYTSTPLLGSETAHEYYRNPATHWSARTTCPPLGSPDQMTGGLFIFVRAPSRSQYEADGWPALDQLAIRGPGGNIALREENTASSKEGWLAFSALAEPGDYRIEVGRENLLDPPRNLALRVFAGWQTQLFLTQRRVPLVGSARICLASANPFDSEDRLGLAYALELALAALQNRSIRLPMSLLERVILERKFSDPILGLVGAHLLLRMEEVPEETALVLQNLEGLLTGGADLQILHALHESRRGRPIPVAPIQGIPILRASVEAAVELSYSVDSLIPEHSDLARIAADTTTDSPWTSWIDAPLAQLEDMSTTTFRRRWEAPSTAYALQALTTDWVAATAGDDDLGRRLGVPAAVWRRRRWNASFDPEGGPTPSSMPEPQPA